MQEMVCQDIVANLRSNFILNANDNDFIVGVEGQKHPQKDQNSRLVDTITMRTSKGFEAFLQALKETGHETAYNKLKEILDTLPDDDETVCTRSKNSTASEVSKKLPLGSDDGKSSGEGSGQDFQDQLGNLSERVAKLENCMDGQAGQKEITDEQQSEVARLKAELESALAEIQTLTKALQSQDSEIKEEKKVNRLRSEQLQKAEKKITELLKTLKRIEEANADLNKGLQAVQKQGAEDRSKIANLESNLVSQKKDLDKQIASQQKDFDTKLASQQEDFKTKIASQQEDLEQSKKQAELNQKESSTQLNLLSQQMEKLMSEIKQANSTPQGTLTVQGLTEQPEGETQESRPAGLHPRTYNGSAARKPTIGRRPFNPK